MRKKYKSKLTVILVAIIVIGVAAYFVQREESKDSAECETCHLDSNLKETPKAKVKSEPSVTQTPTSLQYKNTDYGFEITLSKIWEDSVIEEGEASGAIKTVVFNFKTQDKRFEDSDSLAPALTVFIYNKADWEKIKPEARTSVELESSEKYTFTYSIWSTIPQDLEYITEKELADVIKTFKLNN